MRRFESFRPSQFPQSTEIEQDFEGNPRRIAAVLSNCPNQLSHGR